jgi:hypothetical protein
MAELAALSVAASILQVIDVGLRVLTRLNDFNANANGLPDAFRHISTRLPIFIDALRQTKNGLEDMTDSARAAFRPAIQECLAQIKKLEETMDVVLPKLGESGIARGWKAVRSVRYDSEVREMERVIRAYMEVMAQHQVSTLAVRSISSTFVMGWRCMIATDIGAQIRKLSPYRVRLVSFHGTQSLLNARL